VLGTSNLLDIYIKIQVSIVESESFGTTQLINHFGYLKNACLNSPKHLLHYLCIFHLQQERPPVTLSLGKRKHRS
jgi:hypothetical protein